MAMTYREQLLHPNWQKRRLEALSAAGWSCQSCFCEDTTLHVHHKKYVKGRMVWEYELSELTVLCADCHAQHHAQKELLDRLVDCGPVPQDSIGIAAALLGGYLWGNEWFIDQDLADEARATNPHVFMLGVVASFARLWQQEGAGDRLCAAARALGVEEKFTNSQRAILDAWSWKAPNPE